MAVHAKITLRNFYEDDVESFLEWAGDNNVASFSTWDTFVSKERARDFLKNVAMPHPWFKAVCLNEKPIGSIIIVKGKGVNSCRAELGFMTARRYWGKGYTAEALKVALPTAFKDLQVQRIEALVYPENMASQKVLEQAGFVWEGILQKYIMAKGRARDCIMFSYLAPN